MKAKAELFTLNRGPAVRLLMLISVCVAEVSSVFFLLPLLLTGWKQ